MYNRRLVDDIKGETSGQYSDLLLKLLAAERDTRYEVDVTLAKRDAAEINNVIMVTWFHWTERLLYIGVIVYNRINIMISLGP